MAGSSPAAPRSPEARSPAARGTLLSAADVARVVDRMAHQLIEKAGDELAGLVLIGIPTRGAPFARCLAARLEAFSGTPVDVGTVDITLYRDDLRLRGVRALEPTVLPDAGIDARLRPPLRAGGGDRRPAGRPRRRRAVLRPLGPGRSRRAARPRPPPGRAARRPRRPRTPRAADPGGLRRQERADLAQPAGAGAPRRD